MPTKLKFKGIKKLINLGTDELGEYDLCRNRYNRKEGDPMLARVNADVFIYFYESGSYDGSGAAVWRRDGKWRYQYLGHCSCNGPCEDIETADNATFTIEEVIKVLEGEYNYDNGSRVVPAYLRKNYL